MTSNLSHSPYPKSAEASRTPCTTSPADPQSAEQIAKMGAEQEIRDLSRRLFNRVCEYRYSYNFKWLGRPIIQFPQDMVAIQELIWEVQPELIIETGIAHGGSCILNASILELIGGQGKVLGIDIDIRQHNRKAIEAHRMFHRIEMIEGSSIDPSIINIAQQRAAGKAPVLVILDSNHTHDHVLQELQHYSPMVTKGSYLVVFDTVIEHMPDDAFPQRPWSVGNNPMTAVEQFLAENDRFERVSEIDDKLLLTVAPGGWLRCIKD